MSRRTLSANAPRPSPSRPRAAVGLAVLVLAGAIGASALAQPKPAAQQASAAVSPGAASASTSTSTSTSPVVPDPGTPCVLLFGQGRNFDPQRLDRNRYWDDANASFNLAVREPLAAAGLPVINIVLPVSATDVPANLRGLLDELRKRGCSRVLETTMFSDPAAGLLIARLRLYPVMGALGPQAADSQPRIGGPAYTQQREFALDSRTVERINPRLIGHLMGDEALAALRPK